MKFVVMCNPHSGLPFLRRLVELNMKPDLVVTFDPFSTSRKISPKRFISYLKSKYLYFRSGRDNSNSTNTSFYFCKRHGIPMFPSQIVNSEKMEVKLKKLNPDYIFVFTFPIIDKRIFSIPKKGSVNYHCSLLPKHRGKNPMFWSVLEEDKELGITFHYISEKFDSGDIIEKHIIPASTSYGSEILSNYFHSIAANKFCKLILKMVHDESIVAKSQDGLEYSYDSSDRSKFREINNHMDLEQIKKIVNSFSGYGGAFFKNKNKSYNVIEMVELNSFNIGSNKSIIDEKSIYLRTKDNKICLLISS